MKKLICVFSSMLLFGGCVSSLEYENVSTKKEYKKWIGKKFTLKKPIFIIKNSQYTEKFLVIPDRQTYPTIQEYRKTGKSKKNLMSNEKIIGIADAGSSFEITSIGFYVFSATIGKIGLVVVKDLQNNNEYLIRSTDLFYFSNGKLAPHKVHVGFAEKQITH